MVPENGYNISKIDDLAFHNVVIASPVLTEYWLKHNLRLAEKIILVSEMKQSI